AVGASSTLTVAVVDFADTRAAPLATTATHGTVTVALPPSLTAISPTGGPGRGGTLVTLSGSNFQGGASVTLGGRAATQVSVTDATSLTARTPPHSRTVADVNGNGSVTAVDALCVLRQVAALPEVPNCPVSALQTAVDVAVANPDGLSATLANGFTYQHADVNGSGNVTAVDALCVLRQVAALPATDACPAPAAASAPAPGAAVLQGPSAPVGKSGTQGGRRADG
ncbi:MAG: IPT/TIG domain-containing protein, partial [Chloroflexi bacterium]|nr:IPT/TIG domain-containing protein [Chloroflexota bacterium]